MPIFPKHTKEELLTRPWEELCKERWDRGRPNYRADDDAPFVGDPVVELMEELLDAYNYCRVAQGVTHSPGLAPGSAVSRRNCLVMLQIDLECAIVGIQEEFHCDL